MLFVVLTQTAFAPVMEQAGSALTVIVLWQVLLQPFVFTIVSVSVNEPDAPAFTDTTFVQVLLQPLALVIVSDSVKVPALLALTLTVWLVLAPLMPPLPEM